MVLPTPRLTLLTLAVTALAVTLTVLAASGMAVTVEPWVVGSVATLAALALFDWALIPGSAAIGASRECPEALALGAASEVKVTVTNRSRRWLDCTVHDHHPAGATVAMLPFTLKVAPGEGSECRYRITCTRRGEHRFGPVELRAYGPLGLIARQLKRPADHTVRVYPNFTSVAKYALFALDHRLSQLGIKQKRRRGEGLDFHQLRDYREGDAIRQIDWSAVARTQRLISREYQDERDQRVMFLLDTSGRMRSRDEALSHFDQALNATLLLAYVALRQGDAVGVLAFGRDPRMLPPTKGGTVLGALMNTLFDLEASPGAPDYLAAAEALDSQVRRRALVVLITNLRDEDASEIHPAIQLMQKRHLVMVASLREETVGRMLATPVTDPDAALDVAAARLYLGERYKAFQRLQQRGVFTLDVTPKELPIALVNRYLDVKRSGRL